MDSAVKYLLKVESFEAIGIAVNGYLLANVSFAKSIVDEFVNICHKNNTETVPTDWYLSKNVWNRRLIAFLGIFFEWRWSPGYTVFSLSL